MNLPLDYIWQPAPVSSDSLMVVLHGRGDSAEGFLWLQEAMALDSLNYLLLNAPMPYYTGFSWYGLPPDQLPGIIESRKLLAEVFLETKRSGYPPLKTFLFGFSQGCLMTLEFGARHTQRLGAYIGISGYVYDPATLLREMNHEVNKGDWLITHGTEDELLPVEQTREQIRQLSVGGFEIDYREYSKTHTIDAERELPGIREWLSPRTKSSS